MKLLFSKAFYTYILLASAYAEAGRVSPEEIQKICKHYKFTDCKLLEALVKIESNYKPLSYNSEKTGSFGLLQIQCATAKWMGFKKCKDLFKPKTNIYVGIKYLRFLKSLHKIKDVKTLIASWNAGEPIICKYYNKNKCKPGQFYNQNYVNKVMEAYVAITNREVTNGSSKVGSQNRKSSASGWVHTRNQTNQDLLSEDKVINRN